MQGNPTPQWSNIGTIPTLLSNLGSLTDAGLIEHTGLGGVVANTITTYAKTLLDDSTAAAARTTLGASTVGSNLFTLNNPGADTFLRINANNSVDTRSAVNFRVDIGAGTVNSVQASGGNTGLTFTGGPITGSGTLTIGGILAVANGGTGAANAAAARLNLGAGTVTSVAGSGGTTGLTVTGGPVTGEGTLTLGGTLALANGGTGATNAADARTNLGVAATTHTHVPTVIALTPINSFTVVNGNNLVVFPALGLAIIFFSVARTSIPADATNIFSWSSLYTSLDNTRVSAFGVGAGSIDNLHLYLTGNTLLFYKLSGSATAYDIIEGQIMFRYTP